jgi:hypothetical protein
MKRVGRIERYSYHSRLALNVEATELQFKE